VRILVAEDDPPSRRLLVYLLGTWGYEVVTAGDGGEAIEILGKADSPSLVILDWTMPVLTGPEVAQRLAARARERRRASDPPAPYVILVTSRKERDDIVAGLDAGADDYVVKPFDHGELRARVRVGERTVLLRQELVERIKNLEDARAQVRRLEQVLPICAWCKRIRDTDDAWLPLDQYLAAREGIGLTHGICQECRAKHVDPALDQMRRRAGDLP